MRRYHIMWGMSVNTSHHQNKIICPQNPGCFFWPPAGSSTTSVFIGYGYVAAPALFCKWHLWFDLQNGVRLHYSVMPCCCRNSILRCNRFAIYTTSALGGHRPRLRRVPKPAASIMAGSPSPPAPKGGYESGFEIALLFCMYFLERFETFLY